MPKWGEFVNWVFFGLLAFFAYNLTSDVRRLTDSVAELNTHMAVVVFQISDLYAQVKEKR